MSSILSCASYQRTGESTCLQPAVVSCTTSIGWVGKPAGSKKPRAVAANAKKDAAAASPPKPNSKFSKSDLKRIKQAGPTVDDLFVHFEVETKDKEGNTVENIYDFVPPEVLGTVNYAPEPRWRSLPRMTYMEFYQGLRERNWTNKYYDPDAPAWQLQFFRDSGRFMRPAFEGYRVLVTKADGTQAWVDIDQPGPENFLRDYMGGGSEGAIWKGKRSPQEILHPAQYGYNQVFEQLFQAYEQRISPTARRELADKGWTAATQKDGYNCPADRHLNVSFNLTAPEPSLHTFWENLPQFVFYGFGVSFLGIALAIGIFRPRRQMPTDMFQAMEFAQSKGNARKDGSTGIEFKDVGGLGATVKELQQVVKFLKDPKQFAALEARPPKGILLSGDPGVGKTLVAKAVAGEAGVPFYQMAGSEFVEAIVGVGAARVRDLFKRARAQAPCIIFVDEIDALGIRRASAGVKTNEEREQTLNQLLSEMDGFKPDIGVVFIAATNRPDLLDSALVRAGRFDRKIIIRRPDEGGRAEILAIHARRHVISDTVDLNQLAKDLPGLSGAELGNVLNEGALEAVRRGGNEIIPEDVANAVDRVLQGIRRPSLPDRFPIRRAMAVHEAGTAIIATLLHKATQRIEAVERVSLVPRGRDWSRTIYARGADEDYLIMTRGRLMDRIRVVLGGRAAEEVAIGVPTTYGVSDVRDATRLALRLVANYGLDPVVGITTYAPPPGRLGFMQKSFEVTVDNIDSDLFGDVIPGGGFQPSDQSWHEMRSRAAEIVKEAYKENLEELERRKNAVNAVADALIEKETVTGEELEVLIESNPPRAVSSSSTESPAAAAAAGKGV
jgi:cell division protease FtsH